MIARLAGTLVIRQPGRVVIDVSGVGYEVLIPLSTYYGLGEAGGRVELQIHTHVREDTLTLFGFRTNREKELFVRLIAVSGIGPKTAIAVLSGLEADELIDAVRQGDGARLASVPGIGRKTAERILLELADRLDVIDAQGGAAGASAGPGSASGAPNSVRKDLVSALVNLGYNARVAGDAAGRVLKERGGDPSPPFETLLRETLRTLSR